MNNILNHKVKVKVKLSKLCQYVARSTKSGQANATEWKARRSGNMIGGEDQLSRAVMSSPENVLRKLGTIRPQLAITPKERLIRVSAIA